MAVNWELDFYSRPILDEKEKKLWEVLICDSQRRFEYSKFCHGSEANARWLSTALTDAMDQWNRTYPETPLTEGPEKVRYFRRPMGTIISRACESLNLKGLPSQRTFALYDWLQERYQSFYPTQPGYQPLMPAPPTFEPATPQPLPETLRGDGWQFVTLQKQDLANLGKWSITFKDQIPPALDRLADDTVIPGLVIYSRRATPLAGWMAGFELAAIAYSAAPKPQLLLETGISDRWIVLNLNQPQLIEEAEAFESAKLDSQQLHFLAVQASPDVEEFSGFWVLQSLVLT